MKFFKEEIEEIEEKVDIEDNVFTSMVSGINGEEDRR